MRWHVAALAAVWLIIVGWCGSAVMGQPIAGMVEGQLQPQDEQLISETWGLMESVDTNVDNTQNDYSRGDKLYYLPSVPIKRQTAEEDSGWLVQSQVTIESHASNFFFLSWWMFLCFFKPPYWWPCTTSMKICCS